MSNKCKQHFDAKSLLKFAEENSTDYENNFNYKNYITPHSDMRELVGKIIEEFQSLEKCMNNLIECAIKNDLYKGNVKFNFDNYNSATKIIKALKGVLIEDKIAEKLLYIIQFRNYIIHSHYSNKNRQEIEENSFPYFLFIIFEAYDYISNVMYRSMGQESNIPNVFEKKPATYQ